MNSNKLKAKLVENGKTQKWLAKQLKISEITLSYKINNVTPFSLPQVHKICEVLSLTEEEKVEIFLN